MTQVEPKKYTNGYVKQTNKQRKAGRTYDVCGCSVCGTHFGTLTAVRSAITGSRLKAESDGKVVYQHPDPNFCNYVIEMRKKLEAEKLAKLLEESAVVATESVAEIAEYAPSQEV